MIIMIIILIIMINYDYFHNLFVVRIKWAELIFTYDAGALAAGQSTEI